LLPPSGTLGSVTYFSAAVSGIAVSSWQAWHHSWGESWLGRQRPSRRRTKAGGLPRLRPHLQAIASEISEVFRRADMQLRRHEGAGIVRRSLRQRRRCSRKSSEPPCAQEMPEKRSALWRDMLELRAQWVHPAPSNTAGPAGNGRPRRQTTPPGGEASVSGKNVDKL
jgi:hypothetical protein